ncbi:MAG: ABC transporter permease [Calditrichia bacterium]
MNKVWKIIKREFLARVTSKGFIIGTVLGPFFLAAVTLMPAIIGNYSEPNTQIIQIIDESSLFEDQLTSLFSDTLRNGSPRFVLLNGEKSSYDLDPAPFHDALEKGDVNVLLTIPADILQSNRINYLSQSVSDIDVIRSVQQRFNAAINRIRLENAGFDPTRIDSLTAGLEVNTVKISNGEEQEKGSGQEILTVTIFLMILYVTIILYGQMVMRGVLEEKTSRIMEVLLSSTNAFSLMLGKLFGIGSVGLLQYAIWVVSGLALVSFVGSGMMLPATSFSIAPEVFGYFVLFFLLGYFSFSALFAAVGSMCSTQEDAQALATPVIFLIVIPFIMSLSLGFQDPNGSLTKTLSLLPFFAPMLMFTRILVSNPTGWEIVLSVVINIATVLFLTWVCARIYRVGILMYGKRPTVPEVMRWIRQG